MNNVVPILVALPLGVGFLIPLAVRCHPRLAEVLSNLTLFALGSMSLSLIGRQLTYHMGGWPSPEGIELRVDDLTTLMLLTINGLAFVIGIYYWGLKVLRHQWPFLSNPFQNSGHHFGILRIIGYLAFSKLFLQWKRVAEILDWQIG